MASGDLSFFYASGQLAGSAADLYAIPAGKTLMHAELILFNTDASTAYRPDIHLTDSGGTVSDTNQVVGGVAGVTDIVAGETVTMQLNQHLPTGYKIRGLASTAAKLSYFLSGELRED